MVTVVEALERELGGMGEVGRGSLAASALVLAAQLDNPRVSATAKSMCARVLADVLRSLRELAAEQTEAVSVVDELRARRQAKLPGS